MIDQGHFNLKKYLNNFNNTKIKFKFLLRGVYSFQILVDLKIIHGFFKILTDFNYLQIFKKSMKNIVESYRVFQIILI